MTAEGPAHAFLERALEVVRREVIWSDTFRTLQLSYRHRWGEAVLAEVDVVQPAKDDDR